MNASHRTWSRRDLRWELGRRRMFPACSDQMGWTVPQAVTLEFLREELAAMGPDDPGRGWREYELALCAEHYRLTPDRPFIRSIDAPAPKESSEELYGHAVLPGLMDPSIASDGR